MKRIDELTTPPVIGKRYLVPTVRYKWHGVERDWPVIGPKHTDGEHLNFHYQHYHVDGRFITPAMLAARWLHETVDHAVGKSPLMWMNYETTPMGPTPHPEAVLKVRVCRRETEYAYGDIDVIKKMRVAFKDSPLVQTKCGRVCPHKGAPVDSLKPDERGVITCPLHGLRFDFKTGKPAR